MVTSGEKTTDKDPLLSKEERELAKALGKELWRRREALGLTRVQVVARMPSGIGDRTLLSYEHGIRRILVQRLVELCRALDTHPARVLMAAMSANPFELETMTILVDLPGLARDKSSEFRLIRRWAARKLNDGAAELLEVSPVVVGELACVVGCSHFDLALYLAGFTTSLSDMPLSEDDDV